MDIHPSVGEETTGWKDCSLAFGPPHYLYTCYHLLTHLPVLYKDESLCFRTQDHLKMTIRNHKSNEQEQ